jgi:hypothetical protein
VTERDIECIGAQGVASLLQAARRYDARRTTQALIQRLEQGTAQLKC